MVRLRVSIPVRVRVRVSVAVGVRARVSVGVSVGVSVRVKVTVRVTRVHHVHKMGGVGDGHPTISILVDLSPCPGAGVTEFVQAISCV